MDKSTQAYFRCFYVNIYYLNTTLELNIVWPINCNTVIRLWEWRVIQQQPGDNLNICFVFDGKATYSV